MLLHHHKSATSKPNSSHKNPRFENELTSLVIVWSIFPNRPINQILIRRTTPPAGFI